MTNARFGPHLRDLWHVDADVAYLNHGTVGATPKAVLAHQRSILEAIERNPARFILRELAWHGPEADPTRRMRVAAAAVAEFVGAAADDLVPVDNITTAASAVLQSFRLTPEDEVCTTSVGYGGVTNAAILACRRSGARHRVIDLPLPGAPASAHVDAIADALTERTRLLIVDHLNATTSLVLPVREIADACRARDVAVFADGAHVPGNIHLDVPSLGVDWYGANLHKWAMAPRSTGFLWVSPHRHADLHAPITSWGLDHGIAAEFDAPGTRDPSPFLSAPFAIQWLRDLGGDEGIGAVYAHNHALAVRAGHYLAQRWDVEHATPDSMLGAMITVPLPPRLGSTIDQARRVEAALQAQAIEAPVVTLGDALWLRVSAQVYVGERDIDRVGEAIARLP